MPIAEIAHRSLRACHSNIQKLGYLSATKVPPRGLGGEPARFIKTHPPVEVEPYRTVADELLEGGLQIFSIKYDPTIGDSWNRDPLTGIEAPLSLGKAINYRDESLVGNIKYLWEPNRHLHLTTLAQAYHLTGEKRYKDGVMRHVHSWLRACPYPQGPNWSSALEAGIRLINWSIVWQLLDNVDDLAGSELADQWIDSVYQHCHFIAGYFSRYSSANNHVIGEAAGLFIASVTFPFWRRSKLWADRSQATLEREARLQNGEDGVNREQAIAYQQFVLDFLILAGLAGEASGRVFSEEYWKVIESMIEFLASMIDAGGNLPMIGDADDGFVVRLTPSSSGCPFRSLTNLGAVLFGRRDLLAGEVDDKTYWLLDAKKIGAAVIRSGNGRLAFRPKRTFPQAGYYLLGDKLGEEEEIRMVVDAGPLGYSEIAAHGHADALAIYLSVRGREFLVDPGTYSYHTERRWRDYFRGTAAHNTVTVDGEDQSVGGGPFMWMKHAKAHCDLWESSEAGDLFRGHHDGYNRLKDPVTHHREIRFDRVSRSFFVEDLLICNGRHTIERRWHISERCRVREKGGEYRLVNDGVITELKCLDYDTEMHRFRGDEEPPAGWVSRRFDHKVPTVTLVWRNVIEGTTRLRSVISFGDFASN